MARWFAFSCAVVCLTAALGAEELPKHDSDESFEVEPPLLIPNRSNKSLPDAITAGKPASNLDPDRLEKELERAKKNAAGAERLFKIGVLAKVEVEQQALRVVRLQSGLENARLAQAKRELAQQEQRLAAGEISKADLFQAEVTLARAIEAAHAAAERRESAELEAAELNLRRQQKLLALGSGRKSEVARAEQKLAELKAPKE
jgi:multidrug resistance efflux pump